MAESRFRGHGARLVALGGRMAVGVVAVVLVVVGGGVVIGLAPMLIAALAAAVVVPAVVWLAVPIGRPSPAEGPGLVVVLGRFALVGIVVLAVIQAVPYGRRRQLLGVRHRRRS